MTKEFWVAAGIRALRTFAQAFIAAISAASLLSEVQWVEALSAAGLAALLSVLTSIATGLPEAEKTAAIDMKKEPPDEE